MIGGLGKKMSWVEKDRKINNRRGEGTIIRDSRVRTEAATRLVL